MTNYDKEVLPPPEFVTAASPSLRNDRDEPDDLSILSSFGREEDTDGWSGSSAATAPRGDVP
jgi:hypothetical protein